VVLLDHLVLSFFPDRYPIYFGKTQGFVVEGTPLFALINGRVATTFFFVLSGFVLTAAFFRRRQTTHLVRSAVIRWPRLVLPVLIAVTLSWTLFALHLYWYRDAAGFTKSPWLAYFGAALDTRPFVPRLSDALVDGSLRVFVSGSAISYDSNLWTMHYAFWGSLVALGYAFLAVRLERTPRIVRLAAHVGLIAVAALISPYYAACLSGAILAYILTVRHVTFGIATALGSCVVVSYLSGCTQNSRWCSVFTNAGVDHTYLYIIASLIAILVVRSYAPARQFLTGRLGTFLGAVSYPVYLLHILVICSIGSLVYVRALDHHWPVPSVIASLVSTVAVMAAAYPLAWLDRRWMAALHRIAAT
jgi:peptidoglycan/LPS O-acetylase OafA/YrhL